MDKNLNVFSNIMNHLSCVVFASNGHIEFTPYCRHFDYNFLCKKNLCFTPEFSRTMVLLRTYSLTYT